MKNIYTQILLAVIVIFILAGLLFPFIWNLYLLLRLPFVWKAFSEKAILPQKLHTSDATFSVVDNTHYTANAGLNASIPAKLHFIYLDNANPLQPEWQAARSACLHRNPDWTMFIWDSSSARYLVRNYYPHLLLIWDSYPYPEQRVNALRYMILYTYGGAILDHKFICRYSLEPLRQFDFVAPTASPFGISSNMMLASPNNPYVRDLVRYLPIFNHRWLFLRRLIATLSTGDYYASTIYTMQYNTSSLRVLTSAPEIPPGHILNDFFYIPLFRYLDSSLWQEKNARLRQAFANMDRRLLSGIVMVLLVGVVWSVGMHVTRARRWQGRCEGHGARRVYGEAYNMI